MKFYKNKFNGLLIFQPKIIKDKRGVFYESFRKDKLIKELGYEVKFCQENSVHSNKMVLRGLHFQKKPFAQSKLISVTNGAIIDVVVDLRKNSNTYSKYFKILLSSLNKKQFFIPAGFAHGYISLVDNTIVNYKVDNYYKPEYESGIVYNDANLNIDWGVDQSNLVISKKDNNLSNFKCQEI